VDGGLGMPLMESVKSKERTRLERRSDADRELAKGQASSSMRGWQAAKCPEKILGDIRRRAAEPTFVSRALYWTKMGGMCQRSTGRDNSPNHFFLSCCVSSILCSVLWLLESVPFEMTMHYVDMFDTSQIVIETSGHPCSQPQHRPHQVIRSKQQSWLVLDYISLWCKTSAVTIALL
jgi:hypothetical protein